MKGAVVLVFLLGLTWAFGLLYINESTIIFAYAFAVLNSLQGLFIFIFHVVMNDKVRFAAYECILHNWVIKSAHNWLFM